MLRWILESWSHREVQHGFLGPLRLRQSSCKWIEWWKAERFRKPKKTYYMPSQYNICSFWLEDGVSAVEGLNGEVLKKRWGHGNNLTLIWEIFQIFWKGKAAWMAKYGSFFEMKSDVMIIAILKVWAIYSYSTRGFGDRVLGSSHS